ncbi:hypothetical protein [Aneurinibacillus aneurinilyticus]|uniref:Uncharacterized protein n=1 Tax=Aneurinibacillus aneurinilyticus TaxID=1391 RepID=A0A848CSS9_ANEAE|nr:hypothetical protein [Aneurinibacillus aneurinilyticus]MED0669722.1 hypothetical protein [Aneurinibacillus aneurinilyticus]NMF00575.1 hypothetical protein [Aneurinibacillus aneurinilyticus]
MKEWIGHVNDWLERILLKGIGQLDIDDVKQLERLSNEVKGLNMDFLAQLLTHLAVEGRRYVWGDAQTNLATLVQSYFYVCQYSQLLVENDEQES